MNVDSDATEESGLDIASWMSLGGMMVLGTLMERLSQNQHIDQKDLGELYLRLSESLHPLWKEFAALYRQLRDPLETIKAVAQKLEQEKDSKQQS